MVLVAIHQPNYLPWLGYFHKIYMADVFIILDTVQYAQRTRRTTIRKWPDKSNIPKRLRRSGKDKQLKPTKYLTVPLEHYSHKDSILNLCVDYRRPWVQSHLNQIEFVYRKAPFFDEIFPRLTEIMSPCKHIPRLSRLNHYLIMGLCYLLHMEKHAKLCFASNIPVERLKSTENLLVLIKEVKGTQYLSGTGAQKYQKADRFAEEEIEVIYQQFFPYLEQNPYPQIQGEFVNGLSVLDALFNIGPEGIMTLLEKYEEWYNETY